MKPCALWVLVVGLATAGPVWSRDTDSEGSCPYLRLSLSTPQRVRKAPDDEKLQAEFLGVFGLHLGRAGFEVSEPSPSRFTWELFSQVEPLGDGRLAWSYALLPMPGLAEGVIEFPTFSVIDRAGGERVQFTTYHGLELFRPPEYPLRAALASEKLANLYLPVALRLCAERGSVLELEQARLERIRSELSAEIERVAAHRSQQSKQLELNAEDGKQDSAEPASD
ncbi:MAG: hypothetical protein AAEJ52_11955 [Myxococcota bacterium]